MLRRIRKQPDELTLEDIRKYPVWEFCLDEETEAGQDEGTMRPVSDVECESGSCDWAYATFLLADGTEYEGLIRPAESIDESHPAIFTPGGQVHFWHGALEFGPQDVQMWHARLGKSPGQVFPIRWTCRYAPPSAPSSGTILGFGCMDDRDLPRTSTTDIDDAAFPKGNSDSESPSPDGRLASQLELPLDLPDT